MAPHLVDELYEGLGAQLLYPLLLEAGQVVPLRLPLRLTAGVEGGILCRRLQVSSGDTEALPACTWRSPPGGPDSPWCPPRRCFMMAWFWSQMLLKVLHLERPLGRGFLLIQPPHEYW